MLAQIRPALVLLVLMTLLTGVVYPFAIAGVSQLVFPHQANGSLIVKDGKVIGSDVIGQNFTSAKYFHGRPSATSPAYDASNSSASNYAPTSKALVDRVKGDAAKLSKENPGTPIPVDLVTTSASGVDPDITPAAAYFQVARVARARHLSEAAVKSLVDAHIEGRLFGLIGEPHVNVLKLNLALDAMPASVH